jgi:hypothetical protein
MNAATSTPAWTYRHVGAYLAFRRLAETTIERGGRVQESWAGHELDAAGWQRACATALDRRINLKAGPPPPWRKLDEAYQTALLRDARAIQDRLTRRVRLYQLGTPELRARFSHLLASRED